MILQNVYCSKLTMASSCTRNFKSNFREKKTYMKIGLINWSKSYNKHNFGLWILWLPLTLLIPETIRTCFWFYKSCTITQCLLKFIITSLLHCRICSIISLIWYFYIHRGSKDLITVTVNRTGQITPTQVSISQFILYKLFFVKKETC